MGHSGSLLMIIPTGLQSLEPVIDELTRKMTAAWRKRKNSRNCYRGIHPCVCGKGSDNRDHWVGPKRLLTNSLCIHYLAFHRDEVSPEELRKVAGLPDEEAFPTAKELHVPLWTVERRIEEKRKFGGVSDSSISN